MCIDCHIAIYGLSLPYTDLCYYIYRLLTCYHPLVRPPKSACLDTLTSSVPHRDGLLLEISR